ncbi:DNA methylase N-4/N-6 domain protein [Mahella australiensis 50-1 BON]|uniref:Methyltransferase n=1 Tax=Mahella australiensis (strain DSM 15567 / CIP 107919 / 50-1 BON) TaxID=697281 RepID=F3ZWQ3_MAHA5|nr:DNA methylase N-4/N-6 domain protein [Mahella australiensis 50-1 BON]
MQDLSKRKASKNRTIELSDDEKSLYSSRLLYLNKPVSVSDITDRTINQDIFSAARFLPQQFVNLLFVDPPYNMSKTFNGNTFNKMSMDQYTQWLESWLTLLIPALKPIASLYICGDWRSSAAIFEVMSKYFIIRNRITWEREKGRGSKTNWKNASEDIWFCTVSNKYTFNAENVKLKRLVKAPYKDGSGQPKDWHYDGKNKYRLTYPSNIWTDITVPFWSMPENTHHPTQKPEKLLAKIILASSNPGDIILDPFLGSGTTSVVAKKLGRRYVGIEIDNTYCCLAEKRLAAADRDRSIQGYSDGVFWERNSLNHL